MLSASVCCGRGAGALALPESMAARVLDPDEIGIVAGALVTQFGRQTLCAAGVLDGLSVLRLDDVDLADPDEALLDQPGFAQWAEEWVGPDGAVAGELLAVRDLDAVRPTAWADALHALAESPSGRAALVHDVRLRDRHGRGRDVPSYTAWWLRRELGLDAHCDPAGDPTLAALLDPAPVWVAGLDGDVRRALGVVRGVEDLTPAVAGVVVDRLAEPDRPVALPGLIALWAWLAAAADIVEIDPPHRMRAWTRSGLAIVDADQVVVVDQPMWLQRQDFDAFVIAPLGRAGALADVLDLALATERGAGVVTSDGTEEMVPADAAALLAQLPGPAPARWCRQAQLAVDGVGVDWWVDDTGHPHAVDRVGLAPGLAWAAGSWRSRFVLAAVLADGADVDALVVDAAFD